MGFYDKRVLYFLLNSEANVHCCSMKRITGNTKIEKVGKWLTSSFYNLLVGLDLPAFVRNDGETRLILSEMRGSPRSRDSFISSGPPWSNERRFAERLNCSLNRLCNKRGFTESCKFVFICSEQFDY